MKKSLPKVDGDWGRFFLLQQNALRWELLKTAIELGIFDLTVEGRTLEEICERLSLHRGNSELMLNGLVALGCLSKKGDLYANTSLADVFLASGSETSLGESLLFMEKWMLPVLNGGLKDLVKNGPGERKDIVDPAVWEMGARINVNHSRCGRAQFIAERVSELPEFPHFNRMLDLGAGPGIIALAITAAHPSAKCVVLDQPPVSKVAEEVIGEYGMEDRMTVIGGDYMADDFGTGFDLIMANFTLNFYKDDLGGLMAKVRGALNPGGVFMVMSDGVSLDGTGPADSVLSWLPTALQGDDLAIKTGQISRAMLEAGFVSTERRVFPDEGGMQGHGPVEMTLGRVVSIVDL